MIDKMNLSEATINALIAARNETMEVVDIPLSPTGIGINLLAEAPLGNRVADDGRIAVLEPGVYPIIDKEGTLGVFDYATLGTVLRKAADEARNRGDLTAETLAGGITHETIGKEILIDKSSLNELAKPLVLPNRRGYKSALTQLEVLACLAIDRSTDEELSSKIFFELFNPIQKERKPRGQGAVKAPFIQSANDSVTNALFGRDANAIQPAQYFLNEPIEISTGSNISAKILIANDFELNEAIEAYRLDAYDRFWFEKVCTIAQEGRTEIRGSEILKLAGYKNPHRQSSYSTMASAARSIDKMRRTTVSIDTSNESGKYSKNRGKCIESVTLRNVIMCTIDLEKYEDGTHDFTLKLTPPEQDNPTSALPLFLYAKDKGQVLELPNDDSAFRGPDNIRPTIEARVMWSYVERRIIAKSQSKAIVIETIFKNMDLEKAPKKKKEQLKATLRKMLRNYKSNGKIARYSWKNKGTLREAVVIEPIEGE